MLNNNKNSCQLLQKLQLYRTENVGPVTYRTLLNNYSLEEALNAAKHMATKGGKKNLKIPSLEDMMVELDAHHKMGAEIIDEEHECFPRRSYRDFPPLLSVLGRKELLKQDIIGVIGTRVPSLQGMQYTKYICETLGESNYIIASGFAKGIDTVAHEASLKTGTIAVMPCGIDVIFPLTNMLLYTKVRNEGLIITDRPFHQSASQRNFPQRNKLLAALCKSIVVTEASLYSGSLMTANYAMRINKPVFSVPGHSLDTRYSGNNNLIKNGGILVESPATIIEYLNSYLLEDNEVYKQHSDYHLVTEVTDSMRDRIIYLISSSPISLEGICVHTGFALGEVNYILLELELAGRLERLPNGQVALGSSIL